MWTFKIFFQDDGEFFEYDPFGFQGAAGTEKALPFLESLLNFLELNPTDWEPLVQQAASDLGQFTSTGDATYSDHMMQTLGELGARHIYFQVLYLRYFERRVTKSLEPQMAEELRQLPTQLKAYQRQAQLFLERILDIDQVGRAVQQNTKEAFFFDQPRDDSLFRFEPIPVSFGVIRDGGCGEILYPNIVRDLIDFSLRECVKREIPVRRCRNGGRSFHALFAGSRPGNTQRNNLPPGTKPPRPGKRTVTTSPFRWTSLRLG